MGIAFLLGFAIALGAGTVRNPEFWQSCARRGDRLFAKKAFAEAAVAYQSPDRIGAAQYRNGDFEAAAKTFARVPGAEGAYNQGNAWLMHGQYDDAIKSYNRALGFHPQWKEAEDNKTLAIARKQLIDDAGEDRRESADAYDPDDLVMDINEDHKQGEPTQLNGGEMSDEELRTIWLRRVQTTPGDFLQAKFAYQAARRHQPGTDP